MIEPRRRFICNNVDSNCTKIVFVGVMHMLDTEHYCEPKNTWWVKVPDPLSCIYALFKHIFWLNFLYDCMNYSQ